MTSQLRIDLRERINERHSQWHKDALELYKMAGLEGHEAAKDIFVCLLSIVVMYSKIFDLDPQDIAESIKTAREITGLDDVEKAKRVIDAMRKAREARK